MNFVKSLSRKFKTFLSASLTILLCSALFSQQDVLPKVCHLSGHCFGAIDQLPREIVVRVAEGSIQIEREKQNPVGTATIEVFGPDGTETKYSAKTNTRGEFQIKDLPSGSYLLHVWAPGFNSLTGRIVISADAPEKKKLHFRLTLGV